MHQQRTHLPLASSTRIRPILLYRRARLSQCNAADVDDRLLARIDRRPQQPFFDEKEAIQPSDDNNAFIRPRPQTYMSPSVVDLGTLRPRPEWYPAWMQYKRREANYVFWQDKFSRCSIDVPDIEKRWTVFSTLWFSVMELKYLFFPPAFRYLWFLACRGIMNTAYQAHKSIVLSQCKLDAYLAEKATGGRVRTFSKEMAMRRLHWKNCILGELLYLNHIHKHGEVDKLPPVKRPFQRPTFFWLF